MASPLPSDPSTLALERHEGRRWLPASLRRPGSSPGGRRPRSPGTVSGRAGALAGTVLGRGLLGIYLSVLVLLPLAALLGAVGARRRGGLLARGEHPEALAAIKLTLAVSAIVVVINARRSAR